MTDRQLDILRLIADGYTTAEIARRLSYSPRTVRRDLQQLFDRFQLNNRTHAVVYAIRAGWI